MAIYEIGEGADNRPQLDASAWVADSAHVIGRVRMAAGSSVWYGCVLRGDNEWISLGARCNVQENSVLHTDPGFPMHLGEDVTIGHQAMLHGCTVGDGSLIGIQAVVLNGAKIGKNSLVGAGAIVTEGSEFPDNSLILGAPAKRVKELSPEHVARMRGAAAHYVDNAVRHRDHVKRIA